MKILLCMSLLAVSCLCGCGQKEKVSFSETYDTESIFDELVLFLESKNNVKILNTFPTKNYLEYDSLVIDSKYRTGFFKRANI